MEVDAPQVCGRIGGCGWAWSRLWAGLFPLSLCLLIGAEPASLSVPPAPLALQFPQLEHDFGRVRGGELVRHSFPFTNVGAGVVDIAEVHPSCSCVVLGASPSRIPPGESGGIPFEFHTGNYSGPVTETITIRFPGGDLAPPPVILKVKADIWRPIDLRPAAAVFEYFPDDPGASVFTVRIVNQTAEPLELFPPTSSHPALTAALSPVVPGREFDLTVQVTPPLKPANVVGTITMKTSLASMPRLEVPVHALVPASVSLSPRTLRLPAGPIASAESRTVEIRNHGPNPLVLETPTGNLKGASVTLRETVPGRRFTLVVDLAAGFAFSADGKEEITVKSNHPQYPVIRIPVRPLTPQTSRSP
ncbi:MAG: hypothetical protein RIS76_2781 [Verrucomicrobiota bacterium]|jgi:hypothetical protein